MPEKKEISQTRQAHFRLLRVRRHVSRRKVAQHNAGIRTNLNGSLSLGHISQHMPVFVRSLVGFSCVPLSVPKLYINWANAFTFSPRFRKVPTCCPDVCLLVQHHISRRMSAQYNARISTDTKASISSGNVSRHRPAFIRTIVGVPAYLCPSVMTNLQFLG